MVEIERIQTSGGRKDHVRALRGGSDGGDPATVTLKDASKLKDIGRHCG
jgi:hypothetical protein